MEQTITANLNAAHCIQSSNHIGYTKFYNICTKAITDVPWGSADWTLAVFCVSMVVLIFVIFGSMLLSLR